MFYWYMQFHNNCKQHKFCQKNAMISENAVELHLWNNMPAQMNIKIYMFKHHTVIVCCKVVSMKVWNAANSSNAVLYHVWTTSSQNTPPKNWEHMKWAQKGPLPLTGLQAFCNYITHVETLTSRRHQIECIQISGYPQ